MKSKPEVAVITGGAQGIGKQVALRFAKDGKNVVLLDLNESIGNETLLIVNEFSDSMFLKCDIRKIDDIKNAVKLIVEKYGTIDILINSAGLANRTPIGKVTESEWDLINEVNLKGLFFMTQEVVEVMKPNNSGKIVNLASIRAHQDDGVHTLYTLTKLGVVGMTRSIAVNLGKYGINVNSVSPGYVDSPMGSTNLTKPGWFDWLKSRVPLERFIEIEEVVDTIEFLISDKAKAITGQDIVVDGGWQYKE